MTKVEAFKKLIKFYSYAKDRTKELEEEINLHYYEVSGVKGVDPFANKGTTNPLIKEYARLRNADIVEAMIDRQRWYKTTTRMVEEVLSRIDRNDLELIMDVFIKGIGYAKACEKYGYSNSKALFHDINVILGQAIEQTGF